MDIFDRISKDEGGPLGQYRKKAHGYFMFPKLEGEIQPYMTFNGKKVLAWTFNNYLGLANDPEVRKPDAEAAAKWGLGYPMGARMMSGHTSLHEKLEREFAEFEKKEDAYLLNFGYQGMISILDALLTRHDVVVYDEYTSTTTENIYGSFGGNWGFYLGGGMELNKFIDFEVDLGYQNGRSVTVPNTFLSKTFTGRLIYFTPSLSFKTAIEENISPYAKIGILTGLPLTKVTVSDEDKRFSGGFPLGVTEAIGLNFNATDNLKFFVELTHQSMIYKPTKRREADDTIVKFK